MSLAGDGAGRRVTDAMTRTGPGQLEPAENQQELQPTACKEDTHPKGNDLQIKQKQISPCGHQTAPSMSYFHFQWFGEQHVDFIDNIIRPRVTRALKRASSETCSVSSQDKLASLIRSRLQHLRLGHMCGNFPNNPAAQSFHLQGDIELRL